MTTQSNDDGDDNVNVGASTSTIFDTFINLDDFDFIFNDDEFVSRTPSPTDTGIDLDDFDSIFNDDEIVTRTSTATPTDTAIDLDDFVIPFNDEEIVPSTSTPIDSAIDKIGPSTSQTCNLSICNCFPGFWKSVRRIMLKIPKGIEFIFIVEDFSRVKKKNFFPDTISFANENYNASSYMFIHNYINTHKLKVYKLKVYKTLQQEIKKSIYWEINTYVYCVAYDNHYNH